MAYVDFATPDASLAFAGVRAGRATQQARFSPLEWSVVALAKQDSLGSLRAPGRMARAMAALFGNTAENRFADPRLEALRRVAVHSWHRGFAIPVSEIRGFNEAGYTSGQLELLLTSISRARSTRRQKV